MEARAMARFVRVTPRKARRVVDLIRGLPADEAQAVLAFAPQSASDPVGKVLASAIANATITTLRRISVSIRRRPRAVGSPRCMPSRVSVPSSSGAAERVA